MIDLLLSILRGLPATLGVTLGAFLIGAVLAIPLVLMRRSRVTVLRLVSRIYVDVLRGIPPIVWLFILFFGVGNGFVSLTALQAAIVGLGLISAAYLCEIYRGGFLALSKSQEEAAVALGFTRLDRLRFVLAPQVLRVSIPGMATFLVSLLKDTTVASAIGVRDVMLFASQEAQAAGGGFMPFIMAALLYIVLSIPVALFSRRMDAQMRRKVSK